MSASCFKNLLPLKYGSYQDNFKNQRSFTDSVQLVLSMLSVTIPCEGLVILVMCSLRRWNTNRSCAVEHDVCYQPCTKRPTTRVRVTSPCTRWLVDEVTGGRHVDGSMAAAEEKWLVCDDYGGHTMENGLLWLHGAVAVFTDSIQSTCVVLRNTAATPHELSWTHSRHCQHVQNTVGRKQYSLMYGCVWTPKYS